jgi:hypothetical protein
MTAFESLSYPVSFTPAAVQTMLGALSEARRILSARGVRPDAVAELAVREILAKGIIQKAELGERDPARLRDAAVAHYMSQSPLT